MSDPTPLSTPAAQGTVEQAIDILTDGEGDTLTFCCKNPDFNGLPNECVIVNASWTDWQDQAFRADTRQECLDLALHAYRVACGLEIPKEGWEPAPASPSPEALLASGVEVEPIAKLVYAAMKWAAERAENGKPPDWVDRGNSLAQTEARRFAADIAALTSAPAPEDGSKDMGAHPLGSGQSAGEVEAVADLIEKLAKCRSENAMDQAFLDNSDEIAAAVLKLIADRDGAGTGRDNG